MLQGLHMGKPNSDIIYESHLHDTFELYFVLSDNITVETEEGIYKAKRGELFIFAPFTFHKVTANGAKFERYVVSFDETQVLSRLSCLRGIFFLYKENKYTRYALTDPIAEELMRLFDRGSALLGEKDKDNTLSLAAVLLEVFALLSECEPSMKPAGKSAGIISDILRYTVENAAEGITTSDICRHFCLGKTTLHELFKKNIGIAPGEYLLKYKIKLAKEYLDSGMSVTEAANRSGFNSYSHFIRIFKQKTGYTPHNYGKVETRIKW